MDYKDILAALSSADKAAADSNPYLPLQQSFDQIIAPAVLKASPGSSVGESVIAGLIAGLGGGLFSNLSSGYQDQQSQLANDAIANALTGKVFSPPSGLSPSVFSQLQKVIDAEDLSRISNAKDLSTKLTIDSEVKNKEALFSALSKAQTPEERAYILAAANQLKMLPNDINLSALKEPNRPIQVQSNGVEKLGPKLGVPDLSTVEKQLFNENLQAGIPKIQASASARASVEDKRKAAKLLFGSRLADESQSISQLQDIISKGEEGIAKAGNTGNSIGSMYESLLSYFPNMFPEAAIQASGDTLLDQTKQLGAMLNRIKGTGALSDFETKALFQTAMGSDKTRPQNETILQQYKNGLARAQEHQDFMNYFLEQTGSNPDRAQTLWNIYIKSNPIVTMDPKDGSFKENLNRVPWQKFDFENAYKQYLSGESIRSDAQTRQQQALELLRQRGRIK